MSVERKKKKKKNSLQVA